MDCALSLIQKGHNVFRTTRLLRLSRSHFVEKQKRPIDWKDKRLATNRSPCKQGDDEVVAEIKKALIKFPSFGYKRITSVVNRMRKQLNLSTFNRKKIYRVAKAHSLLLKSGIPTLSGNSREHNGKVGVDQSDLRWCSDGFEFKCLNGEIVTVTFIMDCCDREIISFVAKKGKGLPAWMAQQQVLLAVNRRFGNVQRVPSLLQLLTDNGAGYVAKNTRQLLAKLGIHDCKTPVCSPQSNGMAESMVKTFKRDYLPFFELRTAEEALSLFPVIVNKYNQEHPHSALGYQSPVEFRKSKGLLDKTPTECRKAPVCLIPGYVISQTLNKEEKFTTF